MARPKSALPSMGLDPAKSWNDTATLREALPADRTVAMPEEPRAWLDVAVKLAKTLEEAAVRDRLARLPRDLLDPLRVSLFPAAIEAVGHARAQLDEALAARGEVSLPEDFAADAHALRARMLKVVTHYFEDDPALGESVKALGRKRGHAALAFDLNRLAEVYEAQRAVVERDPKYWREGDVVAARAAAAKVEALLAEARGEAERAWGEHLGRSWSLLAELHDDLRLAGQWLFRHEGGAERFPAMPAAPRKRSPRSKAEGDGSGPRPGSETDGEGRLTGGPGGA